MLYPKVRMDAFNRFAMLWSVFPENHPQSTGQRSLSWQKEAGSNHPVLPVCWRLYAPGRAWPWRFLLLGAGEAEPPAVPQAGPRLAPSLQAGPDPAPGQQGGFVPRAGDHGTLRCWDHPLGC